MDAARSEWGRGPDQALNTKDKTSNVLSPLGLRKVSRSPPNGSSSSSKVFVAAYKQDLSPIIPTSSFFPLSARVCAPPSTRPPNLPISPCDASPLGFHLRSLPCHFLCIRRSLLYSLCIISALLFSTKRYPRSLVRSNIRLLAHNTRSPPPAM